MIAHGNRGSSQPHPGVTPDQDPHLIIQRVPPLCSLLVRQQLALVTHVAQHIQEGHIQQCGTTAAGVHVEGCTHCQATCMGGMTSPGCDSLTASVYSNNIYGLLCSWTGQHVHQYRSHCLADALNCDHESPTYTKCAMRPALQLGSCVADTRLALLSSTSPHPQSGPTGPDAGGTYTAAPPAALQPPANPGRSPSCAAPCRPGASATPAPHHLLCGPRPAPSPCPAAAGHWG
jgi:hypothetical protein